MKETGHSLYVKQYFGGWIRKIQITKVKWWTSPVWWVWGSNCDGAWSMVAEEDKRIRSRGVMGKGEDSAFRDGPATLEASPKVPWSARTTPADCALLRQEFFCIQSGTSDALSWHKTILSFTLNALYWYFLFQRFRMHTSPLTQRVVSGCMEESQCLYLGGNRLCENKPYDRKN